MSAAPPDVNRFLLLNDLPVEGQPSDLLGTSEVAGGLADLIHGSRGQTPFVLAIDGAWGAGKSTLMSQLSAALREWGDVEVVWFNAWTASGVSALTGMLKLVLGRLDKNIVRRSFRRLNSGGLLSGTLRLGVSVAAGFFRIDRAIDQLWDRMAVDSKAREEARQLLQTAMTSWVDEKDGIPRRTITVFIDDLDRCSETTAVEIFEVIKLYLDLPGIAFVLGCDLSVLSRMSVPGTDGAAHVRQYLEKIVQVNYQIPPPGEASVRSMILGYARRSRTEDLLTETMVALIGRQTGGNPRRVKRLINSFVAEYQLDPGWRDFGAEGLMKVVILQHFYPDYYQELLHTDGDLVGDLLGYRLARDWLWRGQRLPGEQYEVATGFLNKYGVAPPPPVRDGYDRDDCLKVLSQLDERVSGRWRQLVDNEDCLALLRTFGDVAERERLLLRLRRRPLSTTPTPAHLRAGAEGQLDGLRLLWVDDNPVGNESLINNLSARGAQVRTALNQKQAIDLLPFFAPNVLVSDVFRDGEEVGFDDLALIRAEGYDGPALFFTSHVTPELKRKAEVAGAEGITASISAVIHWLERHG